VPLALWDLLAWRSLLSRLLGLREPRATAKVAAAALVLGAVHQLAAVLRPLQQWCLAGEHGWLARRLCWPFSAGVVALPSGAAEVATALALVAAVNWFVVVAAEALDALLE
jgi:hypothetical protein